MRALNAQDDRWLCLETPTTAFQIGALLHFDVADPSEFLASVRAHLANRLPRTQLAVQLRAAPFHYDAGVWLRHTDLDLDYHLHHVSTGAPMTRAEVHDYVARQVMVPIDHRHPPFRISVFDRLTEPGAAIMVQTHHSLADGIGFQSIISSLTDAAPVASDSSPIARSERAPMAPLWLTRSGYHFACEAWARRSRRGDVAQATAELAEFRARPDTRRAKTPEVIGLSGPNSAQRSYDTVSLSFDAVRAAAKSAEATVNDVVMTICGAALRGYLAEIGQLPTLGEAPLVAMVPRSTRKPEDGEMGNHLGMLLPRLGTHIADHRQRLDVIRSSMRVEIERASIGERIASTDDRPFGARRRRKVTEEGTMAGNVSISNVPGPAEDRYLGSYLMTANYPTPTLPAGQFLNVTLRRYRQALDFGLMVDATKVPDVTAVTRCFSASFYEVISAL